jgi:phosphoribosylglycinamide formyltransferase-1
VSGDRLRVGVLASGSGTNLQALLDTVHGREATIVAVASDKPGCRALGRAEEAGVPTRTFPRDAYASREERDLAMAEWLRGKGVELVVLAGYMQLCSAAFLSAFPGAVVNVHPSLLPAFPGLGAIAQALGYGAKVTGVTVHFVDEGVDTGPIIFQQAVPIDDLSDVEAVHDRLRPVEHALLTEAVRRAAAGKLRLDPAHPRRVLTG